MAIILVFFSMRELHQEMDDIPTEEKSDEDISGIVYTSYDADKTGNRTENEKYPDDFFPSKKRMECPP